MAQKGLAQANQQMGQRWPVGCVALEITQRCNLDCTLCYLSENSEAVKDLPLAEIMTRVEKIFVAFGRNTDVQVTGGEPTLRKRDELLAIVHRIHALGMRATLMTNGIRATRDLLRDLATAGLADVAFHVDTTQQRRGYQTEVELNALRERYLERTAGLPLSVMFNTTVHDGNFEEIPAVVAFFRAHAGRIRTASFQLQADIGRGIQGARGQAITSATAVAQIERGAGTPLQFSASLVGHPACSRYAMCLAANGSLYNAFDDLRLVAALQCATVGVQFDRAHPTVTARRLAYWLCGHPAFLPSVLGWLARKAWAMREDLVRSRGRVRTLSFVIHNFMDATKLEADRIEACAFKVITAGGPISMCLHNAKRDTFILRPIRFHRTTSTLFWNPLTGTETTEPELAIVGNGEARQHRHAKGRARDWSPRRSSL
jgi:molybdenum cofactor biosynthesis enzyme MoaA